MSLIINAINVKKTYKLVEALKGVSIDIPQGKISALIGPNGAGKTTFIKIILGLVYPDSGDITVDGIPIKKVSIREHIAYLPEVFGYYPYSSIEYTLIYFGKMRGLTGKQLKDKLEENLKLLNISSLRSRKISTLSKGQIQRTAIASTLMGNNKILILDEPFYGLDPIAIKDMKDLFSNLVKEGKTIIINSHILTEMEQICDNVYIINEGYCIGSGEISQLIGNDSLENYFYKKVNKET